ncbi:hypothetical protein Hanom_Chr11g01063041 [Helianthus anomalus]
MKNIPILRVRNIHITISDNFLEYLSGNRARIRLHAAEFGQHYRSSRHQRVYNRHISFNCPNSPLDDDLIVTERKIRA